MDKIGEIESNKAEMTNWKKKKDHSIFNHVNRFKINGLKVPIKSLIGVKKDNLDNTNSHHELLVFIESYSAIEYIFFSSIGRHSSS